MESTSSTSKQRMRSRVQRQSERAPLVGGALTDPLLPTTARVSSDAPVDGELRLAAAPPPQGDGTSQSVLQADFSPGAASSKGQQPLTQSHQQQAAAPASPASATAAAAAATAGGGKSPPAATASTGAGKSASFWRVLGLKGKSAAFWYKLGTKGGGKVGKLRKQPYSQKACYEKALAIDPELKEAWINLGVHCQGGKVGEQEYSQKACFMRALAIDPKFKEAWLGLGDATGDQIAYLAIVMGRLEYSQKDCYEMALSIDPKYADAWNALCIAGGGQVQGKPYSKAECRALCEQYKT